MALTPTQFTTYTDRLARLHQAFRGSLLLNAGTGQGAVLAPLLADDWGASKAIRQYADDIVASGDMAQIAFLGKKLSGPQSVILQVNDNIPKSIALPLLMDISQLCRETLLTGVSDILSYATYQNTSAGGPYNALVCPQFNDLFFLCYGSSLGATNIYALAISDMGNKTVGGAFVAGTAVNATLYAGAKRSQITAATITGTGVVTVTGSARTSAGATVAGRTWQSANVTGDGTFALTPDTAGDILLSVSDITIPGGITVGTITVNGLLPSGRVNPPV